MRDSLHARQQPGPAAFLCYGKNDEWAAGIVLHELLSTAAPGPVGFVSHRPFADFDNPGTYTDASYMDTDRPDTPPLLSATVRDLLQLDPSARLSALDACHRFEAAEEEAEAVAAAVVAAVETARLEAEAEAAARAAREVELAAARVRRREQAAAAVSKPP